MSVFMGSLLAPVPAIRQRLTWRFEVILPTRESVVLEVPAELQGKQPHSLAWRVFWSNSGESTNMHLQVFRARDDLWLSRVRSVA